MHTCPDRYGHRFEPDESATASDIAAPEPAEPFTDLQNEDYSEQNAEAPAHD